MTIEQKRRELFEAWWSSTPIFGDNKRTVAEKAWEAALDAVVIELPPTIEMPNEDDCEDCEQFENTEAIVYTANGMRQACRSAIESTGIGLKVKP